MDEATLTRIQKWVNGAKVAIITFDGGMPSIDFSSSRLWIGCPWRVIVDEPIVAASDTTTIEGDMLDALRGEHVKSVAVHPPLHDLAITFTSGAVLETFATSERYEHWNLIGSEDEGDMIIAGPGSSWSAFG